MTANISQLNTHPEYNATTYDNDISLWELATPVAETDASIKYAKLPNAGSDVAKNQVVRVSGWGANREGGFTLPEDLRWVDVRGVSRADCNTAYYKDGAKILDTMFCAAEDGKDSCQGDSGGPVMAADTSQSLPPLLFLVQTSSQITMVCTNALPRDLGWHRQLGLRLRPPGIPWCLHQTRRAPKLDRQEHLPLGGSPATLNSRAVRDGTVRGLFRFLFFALWSVVLLFTRTLL